MVRLLSVLIYQGLLIRKWATEIFHIFSHYSMKQ